ncbi:MAG TPA: dethiobiotin synthase [Nitrospirota bacterium]|nr:dethiobiotin synthase [Nitrospirota bacterium]
MAKGIFITGTDTGVGKTYIAERLVSGLRRKGMNVGVMKPAETGCGNRAGRLIPSDALRLKKAAATDDSLALINPYRFREPLAPFVAAQRAGKKIDPRVITRSFNTLCRKHEFVVVEGAGGIMVPLTRHFTYRELAYTMRLPVVIVARPGLGTINHTLLTVSALRLQDIPVAGIIINYAIERRVGLAEETSPSIIAEMSDLPILGTVFHGEENLARIVGQVLALPCNGKGSHR